MCRSKWHKFLVCCLLPAGRITRALMMFSYHPERFFPGTQIDFVFYPKGKDGDPNNFTETEPFRGPVHMTLRRALEYLKYMVVRKNIHKPKNDEHSVVTFNYPYQALEESLVNSILCNCLHKSALQKHSSDSCPMG